MKIWKIAQENVPDEYGYNITIDKRVAPVDWDESDIQINSPWTEETVRSFLGLDENAVVYTTLADINDLDEKLVEEEDGDEWSPEEFNIMSRRSDPPPIVIIRKENGQVVIQDGNHRVRYFRMRGYQYVPSWCYDELLTKWYAKKQQEVANGNKNKAKKGQK